MKNLFYYLLIVLVSITVSCSNESLGESSPEEGGNVEEETPEEVVPDQPENNVTTPCDFDLSDVAANSTVNINCVLDLKGETINLPANVNFDFDGGDIVNGKLVFSGGYIDGRLLSSKLAIEGDATLKEPDFTFYATRWELIEGQVPQATAENNRLVIQSVIDLTKSLGATTFRINKLDAFLHGPDKWAYGMRLPSDFNLVMTDDTHLRAFPSPGDYSTILIMILDVENVTVRGGFLHGERDTHTGPDNISGNLMVVKTGINVVVENVHMSYAGSDGINVESFRNAYDPQYVPSRNVLIKGCTFDSNRRNNMAITDGVDIIVEDCTFIKAGVDTPFSKGTAPRYSIDIEPDVQDYARPLQLVEVVIIRNCTETGSIGGALVVAAGDDILVEGNTFEKRTAVNTAFNVKIRNNPSLGGVIAGIDGVTGVRNIEVSGNTIVNSTPGIRATNQAVQIFDNKIINCGVGIQLYDIKDSNVYGNTIESSGIDGDGINALVRLDNVLIENNTINVDDRPFLFTNVNIDNDTYTFTMKDNNFKSAAFGIIQSTIGGTFIGNEFDNGIRFDKSSNIDIRDGNVFNLSSSPIEINGDTSTNISITNNTINNSNAQGRGILGRGNFAGDMNITISGNTFNSAKIDIEGHNGISVGNNKVNGWDNQYSFVRYRGQNSSFSNNTDASGNPINVSDIEGANNSVQ